MSADYSVHTVTIDGVDFPTWQIDDLDDGGVFFAVDPSAVDAFRPIRHGEEVEVKTPDETFTGGVEMVALEHGELSIRVGRREREAP